MEDGYTKIQRFFSACDEIVDGKYPFAEAKIKAILKTIAQSKELTELFGAVTDGFDYPTAKREYLRFPAEKNSSHGRAYLPTARGELLAFVFCLMVEFDAGTMKFNDFLLRYFYEDGSYTASYALFATRMMRPFRDIVKDCFPDLERADFVDRRRVDEILGKIAERVAVEWARVCERGLSAEDKLSAEIMLSELLAAAGRKDAREVKAILVGYRYFLLQTHAGDKSSEQLFELASTL